MGPLGGVLFGFGFRGNAVDSARLYTVITATLFKQIRHKWDSHGHIVLANSAHIRKSRPDFSLELSHFQQEFFKKPLKLLYLDSTAAVSIADCRKPLATGSFSQTPCMPLILLHPLRAPPAFSSFTFPLIYVYHSVYYGPFKINFSDVIDFQASCGTFLFSRYTQSSGETKPSSSTEWYRVYRYSQIEICCSHQYIRCWCICNQADDSAKTFTPPLAM